VSIGGTVVSGTEDAGDVSAMLSFTKQERLVVGAGAVVLTRLVSTDPSFLTGGMLADRWHRGGGNALRPPRLKPTRLPAAGVGRSGASPGLALAP
jgi:hypothetical protein